MKRKIFSKLLMGAFLIASVSMFVSCKDYDDDISKNSAEIEAIKAKLNSDIYATKTDLTNQLNSTKQDLESTLKKLIDAKADASKLADYALKADVDKALADYAKISVIEEQLKKLATAEDLAKKLDAADFENFKKTEGILMAINGSYVDEAEAKTIAQGVLETLDIQGEALKVFNENMPDLSVYLKADDLGEAGKKAGFLTAADIEELTGKVDGLKTLLEGIDNETVAALKKLATEDLLTMEDVDEEIEAKLTAALEELNGKVTDINADLSAINMFIDKKLTSIVLRANFYWEGIEAIEAPYIWQTPVFVPKTDDYKFTYKLTKKPAGEDQVDVTVKGYMAWAGFGGNRELGKYVFAGPYAAHANFPTFDAEGGAKARTAENDGVARGQYLTYNMADKDNQKVTKLDIAYGAVAEFNLNPRIADIEGANIGFMEMDRPVYTRAEGLSINPQVVGYENKGGLLKVPFTVDWENVTKYFVDWTRSQTTNWEGNASAEKEDWSKLWYYGANNAQVSGLDDNDANGCDDNVYNANLPFVALNIGFDQTEKNAAYSVNSDWAVVVPALYQIVALADKNPEEGLDKGTFIKPNGKHEIRKNHLYETVGYGPKLSDLQAQDGLDATTFNDAKYYGAIPMPATHSVKYNSSIDLLDFVETHFNYLTFAQYGKSEYDAVLDNYKGGQVMKDLGLEYRFTIVHYYVGEEETSESAHCSLEASTKYTDLAGSPVKSVVKPRSLIYKPNNDGEFGKYERDLENDGSVEIVDREPLIRVDLVSTKDNNAIIRYGYIKLRITDLDPAQQTDLEVGIDLEKDLYMNCGDEAKLKWYQIETLILKKLGMKKQDFERIYKLEVYGEDGKGYNFMPFIDPTKVTDDTDNPGPLYTKTWQAKRYYRKDGAAGLEMAEVASDKYAAALAEDKLNDWTNINNHFGEVWYTPHDNATEGHNWDEQTNVLVWNFYPGVAVDGVVDYDAARTVYEEDKLTMEQAGNMDDAKYQKLMKVTGVTYLTKGINDTKSVSTTVKFINKVTGKNLWVTLIVPVRKLHFEYGYVENKNWSHWFKFNSAEGGVLDTEGKVWSANNGVLYGTEFDVRINPFKPSNVNYRFLTPEDFNNLLTDHWISKDGLISYKGGAANFSKFEGDKAIASEVTFEFTYPEVGTNSATMGSTKDDKYGMTWVIEGASGTKWTLALGAHGDAWAEGNTAIFAVKKNGGPYDEEVAYLEGEVEGVAKNTKIHYHGLENEAALYPAATDLVNKMGAYDERGKANFTLNGAGSDLTNLKTAKFLEDNKDRAFTAYIKIKVQHECYDPIISKQYFNVRFHRPINVVAKTYEWIDRNLNDNKVNIKDLIEIVDWNRFPVIPFNDKKKEAANTLFNIDFPAYADVITSDYKKMANQNKGIPYEFYGIQELAVRYGEIRTDMPKSMEIRNDLAGTLKDLEKRTVQIKNVDALVSDREAPAGYKTITLLNADGTIAGFGDNDYNQSNYDPAQGKTQFGQLYFNNDGSDTQLFHIFLPVAVKYNWGNIAYDKKFGQDNEKTKLDKDYTQVVWVVIVVNGTH